MCIAKAMAVAQHHDAVRSVSHAVFIGYVCTIRVYSCMCVYSGTEKQHVANDYAERLHIGQVECEV